VFENRVLRNGFGPERDEITGEWRELHNEEHALYCSPNCIRVIRSRGMRWAGNVTRIGERKGVYRVLVGKPEGERPLVRPKRRWGNNIKRSAMGWGVWTEFIWPRIGTGGGHL
jgi:hypothetical protein